ncbi:hypothetical protein OG948_59950 (plasmid) [Embleya sp. NBC_00888]|uniref:hypothetical protein n=1 Tax=Embleya sp. NBC_00888 TaxID=2975960 RepID=UPI002F9177CA|nr:hypothetical protein OG948_59950 [Embleya sp. NBC_00888]
MDEHVVVSLLRLAAADVAQDAAWQRPSDERLVLLGLDALLAGVESPSLAQLAGLGHREHHAARELFAQALEELSLLPLAEDDLEDARWTAARWWSREILAGNLDPLDGATLIWLEAAAELGYPQALQPIVTLAQAATANEDPPAGQQPLKTDIVSAASRFLRAV